MTLRKRIAVTLPAGPRVADTLERVRWAEVTLATFAVDQFRLKGEAHGHRCRI